MTTPPDKGGNGKAPNGSPVLSAAAEAVESALAARPSGILIPDTVADQLAAWPLVVDLLARELPRRDPRAPRAFQVAFLIRTSALTKEGRGAGVMFPEGEPLRDMIPRLEIMLARMKQICECVEQGKPIPDAAPEPEPAAGGQKPTA